MHTLLTSKSIILHMWPTDRKQFLTSWKDLPPTNEVQSTIAGCSLTADAIQQKLESNNVFMIARRSVDVGGVPQVIGCVYVYISSVDCCL